MMVSFLCKVAGDVDWVPITSPYYDSHEDILSYLEGFMGMDSPVTIKSLKIWWE